MKGAVGGAKLNLVIYNIQRLCNGHPTDTNDVARLPRRVFPALKAIYSNIFLTTER